MNCTVEIRRMGNLERGRRWIDGYAVFVNGIERQPWLSKREAEREKKALLEGTR
jgi:hypothetical protein